MFHLLRGNKGLHECKNFVINAANSLNSNGTWNVGGNVQNLRLDDLNHITRGGSIKFDIFKYRRTKLYH